MPIHHRRVPQDRCRRGPPRLRLPVRGSLLRRDPRLPRDHLHRPLARGDGEDGRQGHRPRAHGQGRPAAAAGDDRARADRRRGRRHRQGDRLPADHQGLGRRRRARHDGRATPRGPAGRYQTTRAQAQAIFKNSAVYIEKLPRPQPPHRDPAGLRHARQRRAPRRARLLGAAPPPEAHRGGAVDPRRRRRARGRWAAPRSTARWRSATRAPGRWSSCSTTTASSSSWR